MPKLKDDFRKVIVDETLIEQIKAESKNSAQVLIKVYYYLYGIDLTQPLTQPNTTKVKPWNFRISSVLAIELINYSIDVLKDNATDVNLLWLNYSPSINPGLSRLTIQRREGDINV